MSAAGTTVPSGWLSRERTIAKPGFTRWLVPPAALAIHLMVNTAITGATYDIDGGQQLVEG